MVGDVDFWTPMPSRVLVCAVLLATAANGAAGPRPRRMRHHLRRHSTPGRATPTTEVPPEAVRGSLFLRRRSEDVRRGIRWAIPEMLPGRGRRCGPREPSEPDLSGPVTELAEEPNGVYPSTEAVTFLPPPILMLVLFSVVSHASR